MKLQFDPNQVFQLDAIAAVNNLLMTGQCGQVPCPIIISLLK